MLEPVMSSRQDRSAFIPDDLLMVDEADPEEAIEHLARKLAGVPDVGHLESGNESKSIGPVGARVATNRRLRVAGGALLK